MNILVRNTMWNHSVDNLTLAAILLWGCNPITTRSRQCRVWKIKKNLYVLFFDVPTCQGRSQFPTPESWNHDGGWHSSKFIRCQDIRHCEAIDGKHHHNCILVLCRHKEPSWRPFLHSKGLMNGLLHSWAHEVSKWSSCNHGTPRVLNSIVRSIQQHRKQYTRSLDLLGNAQSGLPEARVRCYDWIRSHHQPTCKSPLMSPRIDSSFDVLSRDGSVQSLWPVKFAPLASRQYLGPQSCSKVSHDLDTNEGCPNNPIETCK